MKTITVTAAIAATLLLGGQQRPLPDVVDDLKKLVAELDALAHPSTTTTIVVPAGSPIQPAIDKAKPGDVIVLDAGATYVGALTLPPKSGVVTIRSSGSVPERRINPGDAGLVAKISSGNAGPALTGAGATNWVLSGLAFQSTPGGAGEVLIFEAAQNITLDRILLVAGPDGQKRAIRGNGKGITLKRSYIANILRAGQDSQAFCAWEGAGPYAIVDNYLEASGENILFGGSDNLGGEATNPADILITGNYLFKPLAWKNLPGTVKNLLELKNATRVVIRDNLLENNWTDAQAGWSVLFTPKNQDGRNPATVVKDVLFERNYIKGAERGINMTGRDWMQVSAQASGYVLRKNVIETAGQCLQVGGELLDLTAEGNVCDNGYNIATLYHDGTSQYAIGTLTFNRNAARHNDYGIIGGGIGVKALASNVTTVASFLDNRFAGIKNGSYPASTVNIDEPTLLAAKAALLKELGR